MEYYSDVFEIFYSYLRTCMLTNGEAVALNAYILLPKLDKSVFEDVGRWCFDDMLRF